MKAVQLVQAECAAYAALGPYGIKDYCCHEYDESCRCLVMTGSKRPCDWFLDAVAPQDAEAQAEYLSPLDGNEAIAPTKERRAMCKRCGREFKTSSNRSEYCSDGCREAARKGQYRDSKRRTRDKNTIKMTSPQSDRNPQLDASQTRILSGSVHAEYDGQALDDLAASRTVDSAAKPSIAR